MLMWLGRKFSLTEARIAFFHFSVFKNQPDSILTHTSQFTPLSFEPVKYSGHGHQKQINFVSA